MEKKPMALYAVDNKIHTFYVLIINNIYQKTTYQ